MVCSMAYNSHLIRLDSLAIDKEVLIAQMFDFAIINDSFEDAFSVHTN
jgi:hypothetical protein